MGDLNTLQQLTDRLVKTPNDTETTQVLATLLDHISSLVLENSQSILIGADAKFSQSSGRLWAVLENSTKSHIIHAGLACALARATRNVAAGCSDNQVWIATICEPSLRKTLHFLTSFYNSQLEEYRLLTTLLAQCLVNMTTGNSATSEKLWKDYMTFTEQNNILTRLLGYPERKTIMATLVFILNSLTAIPEISSEVAESVGGRAMYVGLLDLADQIHEDEDKTDQFHVIYQIFVRLFENEGLGALYLALQPLDGTVSPHQITLFKLLDGYTHSSNSTLPINAFLAQTLLSLSRVAKEWMNSTPSDGQPNENLPQVSAAIVLASQMLSRALMAEQLAWEKSTHASTRSRPLLGKLRDTSDAYVELIIDILRQLDQLLPRIQFGKSRPSYPSSNQPDVSGFQLVKRDLVRLLGIIVHDDKSVQDRIRECGGVQVVLGLCVVDERNPYIREHALFALRNLLRKNKENQDVVKELEPIGKWDENGVLTNYH